MSRTYGYRENCNQFPFLERRADFSNDQIAILVVDDSIVLRSVLRTALTEENFTVYSARDAGEGERILDDHEDIDLIITDFHMPGLDGADFIGRVRRHVHYAVTPILVLTAGADDAEKLRARHAGASGWIVKPFDPAKLAAAIHVLVSGHHRSGSQIKTIPGHRPAE